MSLSVTDTSSNRNEKIVNGGNVLNRSEDRKKVFKAIYTGKKRTKTVKDIEDATGLNSMRVLQEAGKLADEDMIKKVKIDKKIAYEKIPFYSKNKYLILSIAGNKRKTDKIPTKMNPQARSSVVLASFPKSIVKAKQITIDDLDSFSKIRGKVAQKATSFDLYESKIKEGFKDIIKEKGKFTDWGGESNDLYSTRLIFNGKRKTVAIAFKGRATKGNLVPGKMGKNGDQIQRLFKSPADIFLIVYPRQIDQSILDQMKSFAIALSVTENKEIFYGVVDSQDMDRITSSYPNSFK